MSVELNVERVLRAMEWHYEDFDVTELKQIDPQEFVCVVRPVLLNDDALTEDYEDSEVSVHWEPKVGLLILYMEQESYIPAEHYGWLLTQLNELNAPDSGSIIRACVVPPPPGEEDGTHALLTSWNIILQPGVSKESLKQVMDDAFPAFYSQSLNLLDVLNERLEAHTIQ